MDNLEKILMAIFGGIISLAIYSVIVSKKSNTPQVIQASSSFLANIIAAAVNPVGTASTNGNPALNGFTMPGH